MQNVYQDNGEFRKELERIITDQRFTINDKKTRLNHCSTRQEVTGLTVGTKINVSREYIKDIRAILHIWEKYGYNAAYVTFYPRYKSEKPDLWKFYQKEIQNTIEHKRYIQIAWQREQPFDEVNNRLKELVSFIASLLV